MLFLWSINGQLLSVVDSIDIASFDQFPNVILSLAFSTVIDTFLILIYNHNCHASLINIIILVTEFKFVAV